MYLAFSIHEIQYLTGPLQSNVSTPGHPVYRNNLTVNVFGSSFERKEQSQHEENTTDRGRGGREGSRKAASSWMQSINLVAQIEYAAPP